MRRSSLMHPGGWAGRAAAALLASAALATAGLLLGTACSTKEEITGPEGAVAVGEPAIDFSLPNQYGGTTTMSDYRGQVILLTLSALWCVPCREEAEHAEAMYQRYRGQGFMILEVLTDDEILGGERATADDARDWAEEYGITFPVLADTLGTVDQIYGQGAMPVNVVIDRGFVVRSILLGYDEDDLVAAVESLL